MLMANPTDAPQSLPAQIARSRASECLPHLLGYGSRMEIYPLVDERMVLRVPRRTEPQLADEFGNSGRKALASGHQVSAYTERELNDLEAIDSYIGAFLPDTTPFADLDLDGVFRYYSLQRRVRVTQDLRICTGPLTSATSRHSLERFIRDVRDMLYHVGLMPDLAGKGNLVLDRFGMVKLIDINNFRRLIPSVEVEALFPEDVEMEPFILGQRAIDEITPDDFLDDLGHPVFDLSLAALHTLELRGLGRDAGDLGRDPFYEPLQNAQRRKLLSLVHTDMA